MLSQRGISFRERDFFKDPLSESEIRDLIKNSALSDIFSWRSPSFKAMNLDGQSLSHDDLIRLMIEEPRLMRRPLIKVDDELIIGSDWKSIDAALR